MRVAYLLARGVIPEHTSKFSRKDFTLPQLFACLVVKEQQKKTYREAEEAVHPTLRPVPRACEPL